MAQRFLVWSADLPKLENIKIPRSYFSGPFDNIELRMFGDSSQDNFSAVVFLRARVKTPTGEEKTAYVCFGESARCANESNDCPKSRITSSSTRRSTEKGSYTSTNCNC